MSMLKNTYLQ